MKSHHSQPIQTRITSGYSGKSMPKSAITGKPMEEYEIQDAARTLVRAEEIRANPALKAAAQAELQRQSDVIKKAVKK